MNLSIAWARLRGPIRCFVLSAALGLASAGLAARSAGAQTFTPYCFGTAQACPCANAGGPGQGCMNSFLTGSQLSASGSAHVSNDTVLFHVTGLPTSTTIVYFQGNTQQNGGAGSVLGDGLLCVNTSIIRLATRTATGGSSSFGHGIPGDAPISTLGMVNSHAGTRYYQAWYRNTASYCTPDGFNASNGMSILWQP
jgi:hypothetical protein